MEILLQMLCSNGMGWLDLMQNRVDSLIPTSVLGSLCLARPIILLQSEVVRSMHQITGGSPRKEATSIREKAIGSDLGSRDLPFLCPYPLHFYVFFPYS